MAEDRMLTTAEAAERLGVDPSRVRQLIAEGSLKATRFGARPHQIRESDLEAVRERPSTGRPLKPDAKPESLKRRERRKRGLS